MNIKELPLSSQRQRLHQSENIDLDDFESIQHNNINYEEEEDDEQNEEDLHAINEQLEKDHISRAQLMGNLRFPASNNYNRVIVLPNNEGLGFRYDCYNALVLQGRLTEKEFRDCIYELTKICSIQYAKNLEREKTDPFKNEKKTLLWNIPLLVSAIILFALRVFDAVQNNFTFEIGLALLGIDIVAVLVNFLRSQTKKPDLTSFTSAAYAQLSIKINEFNAIHAKKQISWKLHPRLFWIELLVNK